MTLATQNILGIKYFHVVMIAPDRLWHLLDKIFLETNFFTSQGIIMIASINLWNLMFFVSITQPPLDVCFQGKKESMLTSLHVL